MGYLLDTDVVIDVLQKQEPGLSIIQSLIDQDLYINPVVYSETLYGIKKGKPLPKRLLEFQEFLESFEIVFVDIDQSTADQFTNLKIDLEKTGQKLADFDLLIASTALVHNLTLVTKNTRHFSRIKKLRLHKN